MSRGGVSKKIIRRNWRQRGIRLNADTPLTDVDLGHHVLGSGSYGAIDVRKAEWCGAMVAAKTLMDAPEDGNRTFSPTDESSLDLRAFTSQQRRVLQECHLMGQLRHPNVAQVYGVFLRPKDGNPVIISELLGESVEQRLAFGTRLTYRDIVDIGIDVLSGLRYLHTLANPLLHGSVCSSNVLFSHTGSIKLTDSNLALARLYTPTPAMPQLEPASDHLHLPKSESVDSAAPRSATARRYLPLDALDHDCYDLGVDAYAFGILIMAMVLHREPGVDDVKQFQRQTSASSNRLERVRRANDLNDLAREGPAFVDLVNKSIDAFQDGTEQDGPEGKDTVDCGLIRASSKDLMQVASALKNYVDYVRSPSTKATPLARGMLEQEQLGSLVRQMEGQVKATVKAAEVRLHEQEKELEEQVQALRKIHVENRQKLIARIKQLERDVATARKEVEFERMAREEADNELDDLLSRKTPSTEHRAPLDAYTAAKASLSDNLSTGEPTDRHSLVSPESRTPSEEIDGPLGEDGPEPQTFIREVHIKIPSGGLTTVQIDDRNTTGEIVQCLCEEHGISNSEDYSLLLEEEDAFSEKVKKDLEKNRRTFRGERRLESIKKRFRGNDIPALKWLQHDKTLQEQGVDASSQVLALRRHASAVPVEYRSGFLTDLEVDYLECKNAILDGTCPCPLEDAYLFAALQCQVQFGAYPEHNKPRLKSIQEEVRDFLPKDIHRQVAKKSIAKVMSKYAENCQLTPGMAKERYVALCKRLDTYGAALFVVKAVAKTKNKLQPVVLAVTKENLVKIDEKTREVLQKWPLKNIKRWTDSASSIHLDVRDSGQPVSFMTHDGQQIANLLAVYKGIRSSKEKESSIDDHDYEDITPSLPPRHSTVVRSESTYIPKSPRMVSRSRSSAEAPARVSLSVANNSPLVTHSPRLATSPTKSLKSTPPTYAVLEAEDGPASGWSAPELSSDYLSPQDALAHDLGRDDGDDPILVTVEEQAGSDGLC